MILYRYNAPAKVLVSMAPVALIKETESNERIDEEGGGVATLASGTDNSMLRPAVQTMHVASLHLCWHILIEWHVS